jgi:hypothetical protein
VLLNCRIVLILSWNTTKGTKAKDLVFQGRWTTISQGLIPPAVSTDLLSVTMEEQRAITNACGASLAGNYDVLQRNSPHGVEFFDFSREDDCANSTRCARLQPQRERFDMMQQKGLGAEHCCVEIRSIKEQEYEACVWAEVQYLLRMSKKRPAKSSVFSIPGSMLD